MSTTAADLALGAFSEDPPWLVEPDGMSWRHGIPELRRRTQAEVPHLTAGGACPRAAESSLSAPSSARHWPPGT